MKLYQNYEWNITPSKKTEGEKYSHTVVFPLRPAALDYGMKHIN